MSHFQILKIVTSSNLHHENKKLLDHRQVSRMTGELLQAGVVITNNEYHSPIQFYFTGLNDIKPEMISKATQKAREAAMKFATENDSSWAD